MNSTSRMAAIALSGLVLVTIALSAQEITSTQTDTSNTSTQAGQESSPAHAYSKIRIVRISEAKGEIQMDRNTGHGFEDAMTNLPIVEGCRLRTESGAAEIEFEDNSTLRLAPGSLVEFTQLELMPSGAKLNTVNVVRGMVYASLTDAKGNQFTLTFGQQKLQLQPSSHVRLTVDPTEAKLAVFEGTAQVESGGGTTEVGKKKTLTFSMDKQNDPVEAKNVKPEAFDSWDHDAAQYHKQFAASSALASSPYSYGVSDMMYYGSFINAGGCGSMWQPYFVGAGWSPYTNGSWAWYPGAGYSWVSPYPWGWMPYHYGSWSFCPGAGWGWMPGGTWNGLSNAQFAGGASPVGFNPPRPPLNPPRAGQSTLVVVNDKPLPASTLGPDRFVFRNDSAGMGVPRGSLGRLDKFSEGAVRHGSASTPIYFENTARFDGSRPSGPSPSMGMMTSTMRRGYAPPVQSAAYPALGGSPGAGMSSPSPSSSSGMSTARPASGGSSSGGRPR